MNPMNPMEQVQPSPMFRLLQERATCEQTVKNFVREYAGVLDALDEYLPHQLSFRCKSTCFSSRTGGYFDAATSEIIVCEPPQSDARRPQELHDTMHHELIHAIEVIRDNLDLSVPNSLACTEVRASHWANCSHDPLTAKACTRIVAVSSVAVHMPHDQAVLVVDRNFERCYALSDPTRDRF